MDQARAFANVQLLRCLNAGVAAFLNPREAELRGTSALPVRFLANAPTPTQEKDMKSLLIMMAIAAAVGACSFHSETVQRPAPATATVITTPPPPPPVVYVPE
jgi:hypothetical protein